MLYQYRYGPLKLVRSTLRMSIELDTVLWLDTEMHSLAQCVERIMKHRANVRAQTTATHNVGYLLFRIGRDAPLSSEGALVWAHEANTIASILTACAGTYWYASPSTDEPHMKNELLFLLGTHKLLVLQEQ